MVGFLDSAVVLEGLCAMHGKTCTTTRCFFSAQQEPETFDSTSLSFPRTGSLRGSFRGMGAMQTQTQVT